MHFLGFIFKHFWQRNFVFVSYLNFSKSGKFTKRSYWNCHTLSILWFCWSQTDPRLLSPSMSHLWRSRAMSPISWAKDWARTRPLIEDTGRFTVIFSILFLVSDMLKKVETWSRDLCLRHCELIDQFRMTKMNPIVEPVAVYPSESVEHKGKWSE